MYVRTCESINTFALVVYFAMIKISLQLHNHYCNLLISSCGLHSSRPRIIAAGCRANTVINPALR